MCGLLLLLGGGGAFVIWFVYQLLRPIEPPPRPWHFDSRPSSTTRPYTPFGTRDEDEDKDGADPFAPRYRSPLGLVDNPDDEWVEWAIMEDILDGPDEGLFR